MNETQGRELMNFMRTMRCFTLEERKKTVAPCWQCLKLPTWPDNYSASEQALIRDIAKGLYKDAQEMTSRLKYCPATMANEYYRPVHNPLRWDLARSQDNGVLKYNHEAPGITD
jgi:hypothetical protein